MEAINGSSSQLMINAPLSTNINGVDSCGEFKECRKNHAAVLGGHAVDGCGEFMSLPNSLTCAACGCHRNFHRRVLDLFTAVVSQQPLDSRRRKRFRRKFTQVQKERMHSFSEKAGWKMQGCSEIEVEELCQEIGITRGVLRVWMHNNKKKGSVIKEDTSIINESTSTSQ